MFIGDENNYAKAVWGQGLRFGVWQGQDSLALNNGGLVGIGTTSPLGKLDVVSGGSEPQLRLEQTQAGNWARIRMGVSGGTKWDLSVGSGPAPSFSFWNGAANVMVIAHSGNVGIGTTAPQTKLHIAGRTRTDVLEVTGGSDLAEPFEIDGSDTVPAGSVLVIDEQNPGRLRLSRQSYDRCVAGVVSGAGGLNPAITLSQAGATDKGVQVALSGRVYVRADASFGAIRPGDLLTTSDTPGHEMKVTDHQKAQGAIIGKAMSALEEGQGLVLLLVTLQ